MAPLYAYLMALCSIVDYVLIVPLIIVPSFGYSVDIDEMSKGYSEN